MRDEFKSRPEFVREHVWQALTIGALPAINFEDFIEAIARGGQPSCNGAQGRASVAVIEAIYRSSSIGQSVELQVRP